MKATEVFFTRLSPYSAEKVSSDFEKIKDRFIAIDGARLSHRKESLVGKLLLDKVLGLYGIGEYTVQYDDGRKPVLECKDKLYFNISHSDDFVVLAVSNEETGCDIQEIRSYNPKVARRNYCENEIKLIESSEDKDDVFIRLWALKESVLKFTGEGISGGLASYDFSPYADKESFTAFGCNFYVKKMENTYFALCHKKTEIEIENVQM